MDLVNYLQKSVHITLTNEFYYTGKVIEADENSLTLIDKKGKMVSLSKNSIATIREVRK
jgi:small nuclear ribonucleoprotein (snRNP)-like protein